MTFRHTGATRRIPALLIAAGLGLSLAGCGGVPTNRSLSSIHQPVVEKFNYSLDIQTGGGGLAYGEADRLDGWFEAMNLAYGDRVSIDDPTGRPAARAAIERIAARRGLLLNTAPPQTEGYIAADAMRVIVTRTRASVPGCPDWSSDSDFNPLNATSANYGCATNSNLAAMIANPEDLVTGATAQGATVMMSNTQAIEAYRTAPATGAQGLEETGSKGS